MAATRVQVWEEQVVIPTYPAAAPEKSPLFLENRAYQGSSGRVLSQKKYPMRKRTWLTTPFTWKTNI